MACMLVKYFILEILDLVNDQREPNTAPAVRKAETRKPYLAHRTVRKKSKQGKPSSGQPVRGTGVRGHP